jgi:hypothetical protein
MFQPINTPISDSTPFLNGICDSAVILLNSIYKVYCQPFCYLLSTGISSGTWSSIFSEIISRPCMICRGGLCIPFEFCMDTIQGRGLCTLVFSPCSCITPYINRFFTCSLSVLNCMCSPDLILILLRQIESMAKVLGWWCCIFT